MLKAAFFRRLSGASPAPGGGTVSALSAKLAGGLLLMVLGISAPQETVLKGKLQAKNRSLTRLAKKDALAFKQVIQAYKLPRSPEAAAEKRKAAIEKALKKASEIPLKTARLSRELLFVAAELMAKVKPSCASDLGVAVVLLKAALLGGLMNVEINLQALKDEKYKQKLRVEIEQIKKASRAHLLAVTWQVTLRRLPLFLDF